MNKIMDYLSHYLRNDEVSSYPSLFKKRVQTENFRIALMEANYMSFSDASYESCSFDWKNI
jgi:hypothetical protein